MRAHQDVMYCKGFLCAKVAQVFERIGGSAARQAQGYAASARKAYEQGGATNLVHTIRVPGSDIGVPLASVPQALHLNDADFHVDSSSGKTSTEEDSTSTTGSTSSLREEIGLESILRTSVLLASEQDSEGLIKRVLTVLMQVSCTAAEFYR
jgi:hypothetical protein